LTAIILASASPRRAELLRGLGLNFHIKPSRMAEEHFPGESPEVLVTRLALAKAREVAAGVTAGLVIGADTAVVCAGCLLGKPHSREEAYTMLSFLSGRGHEVVTGVALVEAAGGRYLAAHECTRVFFKKLTEAEIRGYLRTGEPMDKAGAYGIQGLGGLLVERIEGCYFNVVGLPLARLAEMLKEFGVNLLVEKGRSTGIPFNAEGTSG
jgi:septum formation protein